MAQPSLRAFLFLSPFLWGGLRVSGSPPGCASCGYRSLGRDAEERLMVEIAKKQLLDKLHLRVPSRTWSQPPSAAVLPLDLRPLLQVALPSPSASLPHFLDGGQKRLHLEVRCDEDGRNLCSLENSLKTSYQPFLMAQVRLLDNPAKHLLRKRSLRCGDDITVCCKKELYIKFKDIQWHDWIIAPEGYHMNYCVGQCPQHLAGSPGIASSFHATVLSQLKVNGINTAASSCCVPTERQPLSMVYFNSQHSIIKTDVPDMIVES